MGQRQLSEEYDSGPYLIIHISIYLGCRPLPFTLARSEGVWFSVSSCSSTCSIASST